MGGDCGRGNGAPRAVGTEETTPMKLEEVRSEKKKEDGEIVIRME